MNTRSWIAALLIGMPIGLVGTEGIAAGHDFKVRGGLAVYLGVIPAEMIRDQAVDHAEAQMHGGPPRGRHQYHITIAVFDETSGERVEEAQVEARATAPGRAPVTRRLEPMNIADTVTFGNYFNLDGDIAYRIQVTISRAGELQPVTVEFTHEH